MADQLKVYLDHLILRESLRYTRPTETMDRGRQQELLAALQMRDLFLSAGGSPVVRQLRKPDFQRATWAWTPEDCVSLLESIINEQVIPSIIMWSSPDSGFKFILDGGHRISVVLAWLNDDWGDRLPADHYEDEEQRNSIAAAAREVRRLVDARVGSIANYEAADKEFERLVNEGRAPKQELHKRQFDQAQFYRALMFGSVSFPLLWVNGNYEKAELSFLNINKIGQKLSEWEQTIVENRNSSFARTVMSVANTHTAKHYWPSDIPAGADAEHLRQKVNEILEGVDKLHNILFEPSYRTPIRSLKQPLLVADTHNRPYYLAELLTVIEGGKGQAPETKRLIERDKYASPEEIISSGHKLLTDALTDCDHLIGPSPKSLALVPSLYFYTAAGRYVRSLLYGLIYWLCSGSDEEVLLRKRVFSAHRAAFEDILLENKEEIVSGITRKTGSGPEVTVQTAKYYQELLQLLAKSDDDTQSDGFLKDYAALTETLTNRRLKPMRAAAGRSRSFSEKQKSAAHLSTIFDSAPRCGICGGMFDPAGDVQHDHIVEAFRGGASTADNQRMVHPFCNNQPNREVIERPRTSKGCWSPSA